MLAFHLIFVVYIGYVFTKNEYFRAKFESPRKKHAYLYLQSP